MAVDIFMKIDGIDGESQDAKHASEIEVLSFNWGATQDSSMHVGTGGGAGKVSVDDLTFVHNVDKGSPILAQHCMSGKHLPKAVLTVRKAGENPLDYYKITMTDVLVSSVSVGGSNDKGKVEYQPQGKDGSASGGVVVGQYDIKAAKVG
jgi:type VI secretion system secreted protein Hcp